MKKTTLILAIVLASATSFAQDLTSKKGEAYLPEAGEWAIGIDAAPFLNYFGNFIGGDGLNTAPTFTNQGEGNILASGVTVSGKMFLDANTAYRGKLRIGFGSDKTTSMVADLDPDASANSMVENVMKMGGSSIVLGAGLEKRKGNTRLQGIYGAEASIGFGSNKTTNEYGNSAIDALTPNPFDPTDPFSFRETEIKQGGIVAFGVNAFIGAEYFFAPKISIGGEYTWGLGFNSAGASEISIERSQFDTNGVEEIVNDTVTGAKTSSFGIDTGLNGAFSLRLMLHF